MAQTDLGVHYLNGLGVRQDNDEAVAWYRKGAAQGLAMAQHNLGVMYDNGLGVDRDPAQVSFPPPPPPHPPLLLLLLFPGLILVIPRVLLGVVPRGQVMHVCVSLPPPPPPPPHARCYGDPSPSHPPLLTGGPRATWGACPSHMFSTC